MVGEGIWEVFSTNEWETFALVFNKRCAVNNDRTEIEGMKIETAKPEQDGRARMKVSLPNLNWIKLQDPEKKIGEFPMKEINGMFHVPKYLDFVLHMVEKGQDNQLKRAFDKRICKQFGSAKLACISKTKRTFTVIIYGLKM